MPNRQWDSTLQQGLCPALQPTSLKFPQKTSLGHRLALNHHEYRSQSSLPGTARSRRDRPRGTSRNCRSRSRCSPCRSWTSSQDAGDVRLVWYARIWIAPSSQWRFEGLPEHDLQPAASYHQLHGVVNITANVVEGAADLEGNLVAT
uniref:Uncharacterized protein n=1 Tax=Spironucleus salmonicida TaxID=348837 RepID=V6LBB6_9EUKA|eukprot:EST41543.1 Hypothetical protein SS50377_18880 [Spironucleus salmonicida]